MLNAVGRALQPNQTSGHVPEAAVYERGIISNQSSLTRFRGTSVEERKRLSIQDSIAYVWI